MVRPIIMLVSALAADKVGKLHYHDDYKELLKAPNVSNGLTVEGNSISTAGVRFFRQKQIYHRLTEIPNDLISQAHLKQYFLIRNKFCL